MLNDVLNTKVNYNWYIALAQAIIFIPLCMIRKIKKFSVYHIIGDIAVICTISALTYESIKTITSDKDYKLDNVKAYNENWAKLLGMAIASIEGIGVVLPIKVIYIINKTIGEHEE